MTTFLWVALALSDHAHTAVASDWLHAVEEPASIAFCRSTQLSFVRTITTAAVFVPFGNPPLTNREAWETYLALLADDRVFFRADEPPDIERWWAHYALRPTASPKLWMDAYLAAFARAAGYTLVTTDGAFRQFEGLDLLLLLDAGGQEATR